MCGGGDSPFWSPTRVCFAPEPFPHQPDLRMLQTQTPCMKGEKEKRGKPINSQQQLPTQAWESSMRHPVIGRRGAHASFSPTHPPFASSYLDRLVTGSRITMHSFTSPNLPKYSLNPSAKQRQKQRGQTRVKAVLQTDRPLRAKQ